MNINRITSLLLLILVFSSGCNAKDLKSQSIDLNKDGLEDIRYENLQNRELKITYLFYSENQVLDKTVEQIWNSDGILVQESYVSNHTGGRKVFIRYFDFEGVVNIDGIAYKSCILNKLKTYGVDQVSIPLNRYLTLNQKVVFSESFLSDGKRILILSKVIHDKYGYGKVAFFDKDKDGVFDKRVLMDYGKLTSEKEVSIQSVATFNILESTN